jgi:adenine-specific DNA methylase
MEDRTRLIEVAFPLAQASVASVHEKNVRHGHISTLHMWPARRPLAACRAALLATLLPDPGDPEKRQALLDQIGGKVVMKDIKTTDDDGVSHTEEKETLEGGVLVWGQEDSHSIKEFGAMIREYYGDKAPKVLDPFAGGGAIPLEAMRLGCEVTASDINPVAWLILKCTLDYPQRFAKNKWPLPGFVSEWDDFIEDFLGGKVRKRKGAAKRPFFEPMQGRLHDLPDADLAWQVRAWGSWVLERSRADLSAAYPVVDGEPTVAYLWARTARDREEPFGRIPLLKTFWLYKKQGRRTALMPVPNVDGSGVTIRLLDEDFFDHAEHRLYEEFPHLKTWEVTAESLNDFLNKGTMNRAGVWSPCTGRPGLIALTMADLRRQGQQGLLGAQMTAVVTEARKGKKTYKRYRLPQQEELAAACVEPEELARLFEAMPFGMPDEPLPVGGGSGASRAFSLHRYGIKKWGDVFTSRQLLALCTFVKHTRKAIKEISQSGTAEALEKAEAIGAYLGLAVDRLADYSSSLCTWHNTAQKMRNTFGRFALPVVWDFAEVSPISDTTGNYNGAIEWISRFISHALNACSAAPGVTVDAQSATAINHKSIDLVLTDPPYYDAIPYSDLMDFFYVWLKRVQHGFTPQIDVIFTSDLSPKWDHETRDGELIDDESRFAGDRAASKRAYEDGMVRAFKASLDSLNVDGRLVAVFANKEADAWETLIAALIKSGAVVTASWPIRTEMPNRTRSMSSAALASSVWIVCKKREAAQPGWEGDVLEEMRKRLFEPRETLGGRNILQYYFDLGIRGPDFIWAALGPALEAYSAHSFVKTPSGGILTVKEFLKEVRKLVLQFSLGELPGFREVQRQTQGRGEAIELDPVTQYYLLHRADFGLQPAPAGACILYANACGKTETELKTVWGVIEQGGMEKRGRPASGDADEEAADEGKGNEYRLRRWEERTKREDLGESRGGLPAPLIDRLHRLIFLYRENRASEVQQVYERWGLSSEKAFGPLLLAIRELAVRDRDDTERRLVEALATQLRLNRRTIMVNDVPTEVDLFRDTEPVTHLVE